MPVHLSCPPKFLERAVKTTILQVLKDSAASNALDEAKRVGRFAGAVGDDVKMVEHDDIGENEKTSGGPGLIKCAAEDGLDRGSAEHRQPVFGDGGDRKAGRVSGNCDQGSPPRGTASRRLFYSGSSGKAEPF